MKIKKIVGETCKTARSLWEEVFYEDSIQFTDYYFEYKAAENVGYVIGEEPYNAMMFRTPYQIQVGGKKKKLSYIVGVATRQKFRHKGYMTALLMYSFEEMYREKQPFTFLMPANPAIYEPFDFCYIYYRDIWSLREPEKTISFLENLTKSSMDKGRSSGQKDESELRAAESENVAFGKLCKEQTKNELRAAESENVAFGKLCKEQTGNESRPEGLWSVRNLLRRFPQYPVMQQLTEFANDYLKEHYEIYVSRDIKYYERQLEESIAQNGDIYVLFEHGEVKAYFLYAREDEEVFIQEVMKSEDGILDFLQKEKAQKPIIMARIIHVEEMLKLLQSGQPRTVLMEIEDDLLPQNDGVYRVEMTSDGSVVTKLKEYRTPDMVKNIRELTSELLQKVCINEIV